MLGANAASGSFPVAKAGCVLFEVDYDLASERSLSVTLTGGGGAFPIPSSGLVRWMID